MSYQQGKRATARTIKNMLSDVSLQSYETLEDLVNKLDQDPDVRVKLGDYTFLDARTGVPLDREASLRRVDELAVISNTIGG